MPNSHAFKPYSEKLKDPRWQKKRLLIFERDNFTCQDCGSTKKPLNVHHLRYVAGKNPWEYNDDDLETLCEECHKVRTLACRIVGGILSTMTVPFQVAVMGFVYGL